MLRFCQYFHHLPLESKGSLTRKNVTAFAFFPLNRPLSCRTSPFFSLKVFLWWDDFTFLYSCRQNSYTLQMDVTSPSFFLAFHIRSWAEWEVRLGWVTVHALLIHPETAPVCLFQGGDRSGGRNWQKTPRQFCAEDLGEMWGLMLEWMWATRRKVSRDRFTRKIVFQVIFPPNIFHFRG